MRLGIVTARIGFNDGQGRVNREIASEALRQGHEVTLFAESVDAEMAARPGVPPGLAAPPRWAPTRLVRDQIFAVRTLRQIAKPANKCDALLSNGFATWNKSDVNAVHFVHSAWRRNSFHPWKLKHDARSFYEWTYGTLNAQLERDAFRRSGRVVAVSEKVRQELIQIGVPADRVLTILNGVDATEFCPGPPERERFGLPPGVQIALFAGDLKSPRKNLDTTLRALADVPGLHLAVAGRQEGTPYPALAQSLGIAERVHFLGFQRAMPALMRSVDLMVFPSRYEACPLVLLEALASGLPVVTSLSAGAGDFVTPDVGAMVADCDDAALLAETIRHVIEDPERFASMSRNARALGQSLSWPAMARRYIELLSEAAEQKVVHG